MTFRRFPLAMNHPNYKPAVVSGYRRTAEGVTNDPPGKPVQFPPVVVNNADQEQEYASKGYIPAGTSDPEAYYRATMGVTDPQRPEFQEYPKCLYQKNGGEVVCRIVGSVKEEEALPGVWHSTPACNDKEEAVSAGTDEPVKQKRAYRKREPKLVSEPVRVGE